MEYRLNVEVSESEVTHLLLCRIVLAAENPQNCFGRGKSINFYSQVAVAALVLALKMKNIEVSNRKGSRKKTLLTLLTDDDNT